VNPFSTSKLNEAHLGNTSSPNSNPAAFNKNTDANSLAEQNRLAKKQDELIRARQRLRDGCIEMDRILNEIVHPELLFAAKAIKNQSLPAEIVELHTSSPLDDLDYSIGLKFRFGDKHLPSKLEIKANPETHQFEISLRFFKGEETTHECSFYELIPEKIHSWAHSLFQREPYDIPYAPKVHKDLFDPSAFKPPFKVKMLENSETSEVATAPTLSEAIKLGSTFSSIFKKNATLSIIDSNEQIIC